MRAVQRSDFSGRRRDRRHERPFGFHTVHPLALLLAAATKMDAEMAALLSEADVRTQLPPLPPAQHCQR